MFKEGGTGQLPCINFLGVPHYVWHKNDGPSLYIKFLFDLGNLDGTFTLRHVSPNQPSVHIR